MPGILAKILQFIAAKYRHLLWQLIKIARLSKSVSSPAKPLSGKGHEVSTKQRKNEMPRSCYTDYLTSEEIQQIRDQFRSADNGRRLLFWTNIPRELAQAWANANAVNTLITMMGPLMDEAHLLKRGVQRSQYIKGVSCLFAELARQKPRILVLTTPPGVPRFPTASTYHSLEEPILKQTVDHLPLLQIDYVHPTVQAAETVEYRHWPIDNSSLWTRRFGNQTRVDTMILSKNVRKGAGGPHFSRERLPPLKTEYLDDKFRIIAVGNVDQASECLRRVRQRLFPTMVVRTYVLAKVLGSTVLRTLQERTRAICVYVSSVITTGSVAGRGRVVGDHFNVRSENGSTAKSCQASAMEAKSKQQKSKAKAIPNPDTNAVDLSCFAVSSKDITKASRKSEVDQLDPNDQLAVQELLNRIGRKKLVGQLAKYSVLLKEYSVKTGKILQYGSCKIDALSKATLSCGKLKLESTAKKASLAKCLVELQMCRRLGIC